MTANLEERIEKVQSTLERANAAAENGNLYTNIDGQKYFHAINILESEGTLQRAEELALHYISDGRRRNSRLGREALSLFGEVALNESQYRLEYNRETLDNTALLEKAVEAVTQAQSIIGPWITKRDPLTFRFKTLLREAQGHYIGRTAEMLEHGGRITMPMIETAVEYARELQDPKKALELGMLFGPNEKYGLFEDALIWANKEGKGALLKLVMGFVQSEDQEEQAFAPYIVETALDVALPDFSEFLLSPEIDQLLLLKLEIAEREYLAQGLLGRDNESIPSSVYNLLEEAKELNPDQPTPMKFQTAISTLSELARLSSWVGKRMSKPSMVPQAEDAPPTPQEIARMKEERYLGWQEELNKKALRGERSDIVTATPGKLEAELWKRGMRGR